MFTASSIPRVSTEKIDEPFGKRFLDNDTNVMFIETTQLDKRRDKQMFLSRLAPDHCPVLIDV